MQLPLQSVTIVMRFLGFVKSTFQDERRKGAEKEEKLSIKVFKLYIVREITMKTAIQCSSNPRLVAKLEIKAAYRGTKQCHGEMELCRFLPLSQEPLKLHRVNVLSFPPSHMRLLSQ